MPLRPCVDGGDEFGALRRAGARFGLAGSTGRAVGDQSHGHDTGREHGRRHAGGGRRHRGDGPTVIAAVTMRWTRSAPSRRSGHRTCCDRGIHRTTDRYVCPVGNHVLRSRDGEVRIAVAHCEVRVAVAHCGRGFVEGAEPSHWYSVFRSSRTDPRSRRRGPEAGGSPARHQRFAVASIPLSSWNLFWPAFTHHVFLGLIVPTVPVIGALLLMPRRSDPLILD